MRNVLIIALLSVTVTVFAIEDTPENRALQVDRYLKVIPPEEMMNDMADNIAMTLMPEMRLAFKDMMTKHLDVAAVTKAIKNSMIKHFTVDEVSALADFCGSPIGKSAMKKLGSCMADTMPAIQGEIMKAQGAAMKAQSESSRKKPDKGK